MQRVQTWQDNPAHWLKRNYAMQQQTIEEVVEWLESLRGQEAIDELRGGKPDKAIVLLTVWRNMTFEIYTQNPELLASELSISVEIARDTIEIAKSNCERLWGWINALT